jgi:hypothetical protein
MQPMESTEGIALGKPDRQPVVLLPSQPAPGRRPRACLTQLLLGLLVMLLVVLVAWLIL